MARIGNPIFSHAGGSKILTGTITLGASGAVASTDLITSGIATAVSRTSAGLYSVTLADTYASLAYGHVAAIVSTAADIQTQVASYTVATKVLVLRTLTGATETDAASGSVLQLLLVVKEM